MRELTILKNFRKIHAATLIAIVLTIGVVPVHAEPLLIDLIPHIGCSMPMGSEGDAWRKGYSFGLEGYQVCDRPLQFAARLAFHRWRTNAKEMLEMNGHDMKVESNDGWKAIGDVTFLARYNIPQLKSDSFSLSLDGGLGVYYVRSSEVNLKGFYTIGETARNREIRLDADTQVAPGITLGFNMKIKKRIQPAFRFQHIFTGDDGVSIILLSLGLIAKN